MEVLVFPLFTSHILLVIYCCVISFFLIAALPVKLWYWSGVGYRYFLTTTNIYYTNTITLVLVLHHNTQRIAHPWWVIRQFILLSWQPNIMCVQTKYKTNLIRILFLTIQCYKRNFLFSFKSQSTYQTVHSLLLLLFW